MARKPKIFIADLIHDQRIYSYCAPLNIGCLAAKLDESFGDAIETRLFKFPAPLIEALDERPDILALSNYDWNVNLNKAVIQMARATNPDVFIVMGGPNIRRGPEGAKQFLSERSDIDVYVVNEGEGAFAGLVGHFLGSPGHLRETLIRARVVLPQIAYTSEDRSLVFGPLSPSASATPIPHPSAWLTGRMDQFLDVVSFPLAPIVETTRGCPYACTFCTAWGTAATGDKSIRQFPLETVFEELHYIFRQSKNPFYLFVGDANLGILERDVLIAEELRRLADRYRNVIGIGLDSSKNMVKRNIEIYRILGDLSIPTFAQQTFNIDVSEKIGRKNVSQETVQELVAAVHADGCQISTDLLVGLPTENRQRHIDSIKKAYDCGFDRLQVSDIRLLKGTEMEEDYQRARYGLKSKVRIIPNAFGDYFGSKVIDYEHCVRETSCMTEQDFLDLRLLHAHMFVTLNLEIGRPLFDFSTRHGLHAIDLLAAVSVRPPAAAFPALFRYFSFYLDQARGEWFDDEDAANAHYFQQEVFARIMNEGFPKLNYDYAARLALEPSLKRELVGWIACILKDRLPDVDPAVVDEIALFSEARIMSVPLDETPQVLFFSEAAMREIAGYLGGAPIPAGGLAPIRLTAEPHHLDLLRKNLEQYGASNSLALAVQLTLQYASKALVRRAEVTHRSAVVSPLPGDIFAEGQAAGRV